MWWKGCAASDVNRIRPSGVQPRTVALAPRNVSRSACPRCGGELPPAARFCPTCGRPVDPEVGPPPPPPAPPIWPTLRPPPWLTSDWPLVGLGGVVLLGLLFALSALLGMVAAVAAS